MRTCWPQKKVVEVCERVSVGIVIEPSKYYTDRGGVRAFRSQNVRENRVNDSKWVYLTEEGHRKNSKSILQTNDVLVVRTGAPGVACVLPSEYSGSNCIDLVIARPTPHLIDSRYLCAFFNSDYGRTQSLGMQNGLAQKHLNVGAVEEMQVPVPPLPEQQKIADILGTWDKALEKLDALITAKDHRKQALMQQLLTGQRRLLGFDASKGKVLPTHHGAYPADWSRVRLGDITVESTARAADITGAVVLSCTKHRGLVPSEEYFGKRVYAADTSAYKVVRRAEFAYATNHIEEGSIGYQDVCDVGLVSPIYTVFRSRDTVEDRYLFRLLKSSLLIHLYQVNTSASVDRRGSLRYDEFANIKVNLPAKPEQRAIADVLDAADAELRILRQQRAALDQQKRGLMQKLLTGRVRVTT